MKQRYKIQCFNQPSSPMTDGGVVRNSVQAPLLSLLCCQRRFMLAMTIWHWRIKTGKQLTRFHCECPNDCHPQTMSYHSQGHCGVSPQSTQWHQIALLSFTSTSRLSVAFFMYLLRVWKYNKLFVESIQGGTVTKTATINELSVPTNKNE